MTNKYLIYFVLFSIEIVQPFYILFAQEIEKPYEFYLGKSANASQINENFDVLYNTLNQINTDKNLWLDELVKSYTFNNDQLANSAQINQNFDELFSQINSILTIYNQATVTKPHQFASDMIVLPSQINENFDLLYANVNNIRKLGALADPTQLNSDFDELYEKVSGWLAKVNQPEITKPNTFDPSIQPDADQVNENFDHLVLSLNYLLTEFQQPKITKPFHFLNEIAAYQVYINFDVLNSVPNTLFVVFLNQNFDVLYEQVNGWLVKVNEPEVTKPYTFVTDSLANADQINANFDQLYTAVNRLLTGLHQPTITKPYQIINGTQGDANQVNQNFDTLYTAANAIHPRFPEVQKIPDTGQTTCNNGAGTVINCPAPGQPLSQDGSYSINPPSYSDNGDKTLTDNVTGLIWQKTDDNTTKTWDSAISYCVSNTAGLPGSGWRLPAVKELSFIHDLGKFNPSSNSAFSSVKPTDYWSSTTYLPDNSNAWTASYSGGSAYYARKINSHYVRCVRSGATNQDNSFYDNGDGTIIGLSTGLTWQQAESSSMTWEAALAYCENESNLGGKSDWRLPSANELQSLSDYSKYNPAIDQSFFPNAESSWSSFYWSSSPNAYYGDKAWGVTPSIGGVAAYYKSKSYYVRCVRGGQ